MDKEGEPQRRVSPALAALRGRDEDAPAHIRATRAYAAGEISWDEAERITHESEQASHRARRAQRENRRASDPRADRPPPRPSRQWARAMDTTLARDARLTPLARVLAQVVVAEIGDRGKRLLPNAYLARVLRISERHVKRLLAQLKRHGYLAAWTVSRPGGKTLGRCVALMPALRPFWHAARRAVGRDPLAAADGGGRSSSGEPGGTSPSPHKSPSGIPDQSPTAVGAALPGALTSTAGFDPG